MTSDIYQLHITLKNSKPKIWRRILIPSDCLLLDFHIIIQQTMGWKNCHLHQFIYNKKYYSIKRKDDFTWDNSNTVDYKIKKLKILDLLKKEKENITYEYDFGNRWSHFIKLEKIIPFNSSLTYPLCVTGNMNCPPENSGGILAYIEMLDVLKNPNHPQHKGLVIWLGEDFDPEYFNANEINNTLHNKNKEKV